jgi:hypothetical protein
MLVWAIIATLFFIGSLFVIFNLLRKYEKLEEDSDKYYETTELNNRALAERVVFIDNEINTIDRRGSFEADDEVGVFFKKIKELRDLLKEYVEI